jgi:hypothetical protein
VTTAKATAEDLTIEPLTAERFGDLASLFDQGGDPKHCWCTWYRLPNPAYSKATPSDKRAHLGVLARMRQATPASTPRPIVRRALTAQDR